MRCRPAWGVFVSGRVSCSPTHPVDASATDPVEAVKAATDGFGADVVVEAVGHPEVLRQAFFSRAPA